MFGLDLAALLLVCLIIFYAIAKLIILLAPAIVSTCVAAGCGATAWGMGSTLPFDDVSLLFTTLQLIATLVIGWWALQAWARVFAPAGPAKRPRKRSNRRRAAYA